MMNSVKIKEIINISKKASKSILDIYNSEDFEIEVKDDYSPLTIADKTSHKIIKEGLSKLFPQIPILSEEGKEIQFEGRKSWDKFWLIDPLDGTKEFIKKKRRIYC